MTQLLNDGRLSELVDEVSLLALLYRRMMLCDVRVAVVVLVEVVDHPNVDRPLQD